MKHLFFSIILLSFLLQGNAQNTTDSIQTVVNQLFEGMQNSDTIMIASCFSDNAIMQTIVKNKEQQNVVKTASIKDFIKSIGSLKKGDAEEKITILSTLHHDGLAILWASYKFYYKGKFSHCGIDSFQLVRLENGWKIQYLIDTRNKSQCE